MPFLQRLAITCLITLSSVAVAADRKPQAPERPPAPLDIITTAPANRASLKVHFIENHDGDGEGEEQPSSIMYSTGIKANLGTSMTVTDLRICKRPAEKEICQAFAKMISHAPPALGTDITETRIGGSDYRTVFLAPVASLEYPGVDGFKAFLGVDSQDLPLGYLVLYVYAKKGSSLIQLNTKVGECSALVKPNESDVAYYRRNCVSNQILQKAKSKGKDLTELFRLER
jgi:hypothetical protein